MGRHGNCQQVVLDEFGDSLGVDHEVAPREVEPGSFLFLLFEVVDPQKVLVQGVITTKLLKQFLEEVVVAGSQVDQLLPGPGHSLNEVVEILG